MTGLPLILAFIVAIVLMIVMISKFKIHPFISIMLISVVLGIIAGIPIVDQTLEDGTKVSGLASVIGAGFSGTFSSIGIVIILGALIGSILEQTGAALKLADMVIKLVGKNHPVLAMELMGWVVSIPVFCDSGFVILNPIRKALVQRTSALSAPSSRWQQDISSQTSSERKSRQQTKLTGQKSRRHTRSSSLNTENSRAGSLLWLRSSSRSSSWVSLPQSPWQAEKDLP